MFAAGCSWSRLWLKTWREPLKPSGVTLKVNKQKSKDWIWDSSPNHRSFFWEKSGTKMKVAIVHRLFWDSNDIFPTKGLSPMAKTWCAESRIPSLWLQETFKHCGYLFWKKKGKLLLPKKMAVKMKANEARPLPKVTFNVSHHGPLTLTPLSF